MTEAATPPAALEPDTLEQQLRAALAPALLLVRPIGAGGMARVFLAREPALKRLVAVKVLSGDLAASPESRARFEREAQAVASLSHPNIVAIHTVGELKDGTPYFVMQFVEGRSMSARLEQDGPLSVVEARRTIGEVADALAAAHAQGIIHRDVKPANILYEDATGRSLVSDFGIAAMHVEPTAPAQMRLTGTGMIVGTPQYMSPEQLLAEPVGQATDVYSLGLLAHELLTGKGPFRASSPHELIAAHLRDTPARLSSLRADVDPELDEIVARCLQKDATKRPTAAEIAQRLAPGGAALLEWPPPGLDELHGRMRWVSKPWLAGGGAVVTSTLAAYIGGSSMNSVVGSAGTVIILVGLMVGAALVIEGMRRGVRVGIATTRAIKGGYAWNTVLETLADVRGDTGNIVTASREYASLEPRQRDRVRWWRIMRELSLLAAGVLAIPLLILSFVLGRSIGSGFVWLAAAVMGALLVLAATLAVTEHRLFAARRARRTRAAASDVARLADPWNESFERARGEQTLGRGSRRRSLLGHLGAYAAAALVTLAGLLMVPLTVIATVGPVVMYGPGMNHVTSRLASIRDARNLVLPRDSAITGLVAGRALHLLLRSGGDTAVAAFPEISLTRPPLAPWAQDTLPPGLFLSSRDPRQHRGIPEAGRILAAARRGFTPAEMAYLARLAGASQWRLADTLARAPALDLYGARYRMPLPDTIGWWDLPTTQYRALRQMSQASVAVAAYHFARGRRDSSELALRRTLSAGFVLMDHGFTAYDQLSGAVIAREARNYLVELWEMSGDPRAPALRAVRDAVAASDEQSPQTSTDWLGRGLSQRDSRSIRRAMVRYASDSTNPRGVRFEVLTWLALAPCTNLRELLFGFDADVDSAFAIATRQLARFPSDSMRFALARRSAESLDALSPGRTDDEIMSALRGAGRLLNNPRLSGCTMVVLNNL